MKKGRERKTKVLHKLSSKLNVESEHINVVNRKKTIVIVLLIFLCFHQYLDKKVLTSCSESAARLARTTSWWC